MGTKPRFYVSDLLDALNKLSAFNSVPLTEMELIDESGEILTYTPEQIKDWSFMGLANSGFISDGFYKTIESLPED